MTALMAPNVGALDRDLRAVAGLALLTLAFASGLPLFEGGVAKTLPGVVGAVMLAVAALRVRPLCTLIGVRTCRAA